MRIFNDAKERTMCGLNEVAQNVGEVLQKHSNELVEKVRNLLLCKSEDLKRFLTWYIQVELSIQTAWSSHEKYASVSKHACDSITKLIEEIDELLLETNKQEAT